MKARDYFEVGDLTQALAAATEEVKQKPTDLARRMLLAELLCFAGELERADKHLDAIAQQDPNTAMVVAVQRQLIRAEQSRREFFEQGRLPEFLGPPQGAVRCCLEASIHIREHRPEEAARILEEAESRRPAAGGTCGGAAFDDFRDADDLMAPILEVLTSTGKYFWIPVDRVELIEFHKPQRPFDLAWRRAHMVVHGGPDGEVFLPALYAGTHVAADDELRLGRKTDWQGGNGTPVRGVGQRMYLVGEEALGVMDFQELCFNISATEGDDGEGAG